MAEQHLQSEERSIRKNFRPAMEVREAMREDPGGSRKGLVKRAKTRIGKKMGYFTATLH